MNEIIHPVIFVRSTRSSTSRSPTQHNERSHSCVNRIMSWNCYYQLRKQIAPQTLLFCHSIFPHHESLHYPNPLTICFRYRPLPSQSISLTEATLSTYPRESLTRLIPNEVKQSTLHHSFLILLLIPHHVYDSQGLEDGCCGWCSFPQRQQPHEARSQFLSDHSRDTSPFSPVVRSFPGVHPSSRSHFQGACCGGQRYHND